MILLIDNYDSFVFNLARYVAELGFENRVVRNDAVSVAEVQNLAPQAVILSPGPCTPREAGICVELVRELSGCIPLLGVCLGHQAIAAAWGAAIVRAPEPVHGRTSLITHDRRRLFSGIASPCRVTRYHSLIVDEPSLPACLNVTARTGEGLVMAFEHRAAPVFGVQFHPEAVLTQSGHRLLANFLTLAGLPVDTAAGLLPREQGLGRDGLARDVASSFSGDDSGNWEFPEETDRPLHW